MLCMTLAMESHFHSFTFFHRDGDSVFNDYDNCVNLPNAEQANKDDDNFGEYMVGFKKVHDDHQNLFTGQLNDINSHHISPAC